MKYRISNLNIFFKYHIFFIFIFTGYIVSYFLFKDFTLFYIDRLDNEIVYNHLLGKFYKGDHAAADIFLNGETKIYWLRRFFQPYSLLYIFDTKFAFWFFDITTKIVSYFSFYLLAKKFRGNHTVNSLSSCFFASLNSYSIWGLLITTFPYFLYLILFKKKLKFIINGFDFCFEMILIPSINFILILYICAILNLIILECVKDLLFNHLFGQLLVHLLLKFGGLFFLQNKNL